MTSFYKSPNIVSWPTALLLLLIYLFSNFSLQAQISGLVTNSSGEPLAFAAVYVKGTTIGTSTNADGKYSLKLPNGQHSLVARYIGYKSESKEIQYDGSPRSVNFNLKREAYTLDEVIVSQEREDPAYAIMRKAIARRPYYLDLIQSYSCDVYIKGAMALDEMPKQFMGEEITNDPEQFMDSLGLLYLSETRSEYYVRRPRDQKEIVKSSIVAGSDRGLSFNTALFLSSNLYENSVQLQRPIVSPIARAALNYYDYKLLGESKDTARRTVYKIKVIPKHTEEAVFGGEIYINDSLWNIRGADLYVTGSSLNQPLFDTLRLKKTYVPVRLPDAWMPISHEINFDLGVFGFGVSGRFIGIFSDYTLGIDYPKGFFNHELIRYADSAKELSHQYWDSVRPIPLSDSEIKDYQVKDSVRRIRNSPEYIDSVDRASNSFEVMDIFTGYTYRRRIKRYEFTIGSPIGISGFDAVRGLYFGWPQSVRWWNGDQSDLDWELQNRLIYSIGDGVLRGGLELRHQFKTRSEGKWYVRVAREVRQFNPENPVLSLINSWESIFNKVHKMKIFERTGGEAGILFDLLPGLQIHAQAGYFQRNQLEINSSYTLFGKDEPYNSNLPVHPSIDSTFFKPHDILSFELKLEYTPGQKYLVLPGQRMVMGSRWPTLRLNYRKGISAFSSDVNYDFLSLSVDKSHKLGLPGNLHWRIEHGRFLNSEALYFMDYAHFLGNESVLGIPSDYTKGFQMLSYYGRSTIEPYTTVHFEHSFKGFLLDQIPFIRSLKWEMIIGGRSLIQHPVYSELSAGLGNIGIGFFRPLRADIVLSFDEAEYTGLGFVLGIDFLSRSSPSAESPSPSFSF